MSEEHAIDDRVATVKRLISTMGLPNKADNVSNEAMISEIQITRSYFMNLIGLNGTLRAIWRDRFVLPVIMLQAKGRSSAPPQKESSLKSQEDWPGNRSIRGDLP